VGVEGAATAPLVQQRRTLVTGAFRERPRRQESRGLICGSARGYLGRASAEGRSVVRVFVTLLIAVILGACAGPPRTAPDRPDAETTDRKGLDFKRGTY
jgi:hypothetical protein